VSLSFLADADLNQDIVAGVRGREPAVDFMTANEANLEGRSDPEVLEFAASQGRIFLSHTIPALCLFTFRREWARAVRVQASYWSANALPWGR